MPENKEARTPLEFYFDFTSPYGYLASEKIDALAAKYGRTVIWRPILLGAIFKQTGVTPLISVPKKGEYSKLDFERSARFMGVPYQAPSRFPVPTQVAARAYYWLHERDSDEARRFAQAVYRAFFVADRDISNPEVVMDIATQQGIAPAELAAALDTPEIKDRLRHETDAAFGKGVFGSPYILCDGEPFFGADRLSQLEARLTGQAF